MIFVLNRISYKLLNIIEILSGGEKMIGLDFVKRVDKDWKKHITFADGKAYFDDFCPLSSSRCRQEDCLFWNKLYNICGYINNNSQ